MPFIVNGQILNKPIYKGATLNAIHVWLQNHWTGTPDASTSTLSQDGSVVATNSHKDPNALVKMGLLNCTATQVGRNWRYTSTDANVSAVWGMFSSALPVGTVIYYKISADDGIQTTLQNTKLLKQNSSGERWWSVDRVGDHAIFFVQVDQVSVSRPHWKGSPNTRLRIMPRFSLLESAGSMGTRMREVSYESSDEENT